MGLRWFFPLLMIFLLAACNGDSNPVPTRVVIEPTVETATPEPTTTLTPTALPTSTPLPIPRTLASSAEEQSYLRFVHASYALDAIDIYIDGLALGLGLDYTDITQPTGIVAGSYIAYAFPSGTSFATNQRPIASVDFTIAPGQTLTVLLSGANDAPMLVILPEIDAPLPLDTSRVDLIHALVGTESVTLQQNGTDITTPIYINEQTTPVNLPSDAVLLNVVDTNGITVATFNEPLPDLYRVTFVLAGDVRIPNSVQLLSFRQRVSGIARVRAINVSPDVTLADVYINGQAIFQQVGYGRSSDWVEFGASTVTADIYPTGSAPATGTPLTSRQFNLNEGENLSIVLSGTADNLRLIRLRDDLSPTPPERARITFIHSLPDAGRATINPLADQVDQLDYTQTSEGILIPSGSADLTWVNTDDNQSILEQVTGAVFEPGFAYVYLLTGHSESEAVIFGTSVGIDEAFVDPATPAPTDIPQLPTLIRFVNAIDSRLPMDVYFDEIPSFIGMAHAVASPSLVITPGLHTISLRQPGVPTPEAGAGAPTANDLTTVGFEFSESTEYTLYAIGADYAVTQLVIQETRFITSEPSGMATVRLINIGNRTNTEFGLAVRRSALGPMGAVTDPEIITEIPPFRQVLTGASQTLINRIESGEFSDVAAVNPDTYTVLIFQTDNGYTAKAEYDFVMEPNRHYDFIIQELSNGAVNLFVAPHN